MKSIFLGIVLFCSVTRYSRANIIDGYTDKLSYRTSETITFFINGSPPAGGSGNFDLIAMDGSVAAIIPGFNAITPQAASTPYPWIDGFGYAPSNMWTVPSTLVSGFYLLDGVVPIIIKDPNIPTTSDIVVVLPTNTLEAYNRNDGNLNNHSLYSTPPNTTVSFLRPFDILQQQFTYMQGFLNWIITSDIPNNYSINYISDEDMDYYDEIRNARLLIVIGHSEYWTRRARLNFDKFVDGDGVNAGKDALILSGNTMWWQVRYENDNGNPQLICYRGTPWGYNNDPITDHANPNYDPLLATYHWGEWSLKYSTVSSIGSDWLRGGYGVDIGVSATIPCYGGYNGFNITLPNSPLLAGLGYDLHDHINFATGEYDGTLVQMDGNRNFIPDVNGDPQLDVSALGFYRAEMIGYDEVTDDANKAGGYPDGNNPNPNYCPFMVFQKTCTSGTIINVNSNQWCSNWVIGHGQSGAINPQGNPYCGASASLIPDPNIPQITANMINLMMQDQMQDLNGNNLFYNSAPASPYISLTPAYSNVSYNACSGGSIEITPCGIHQMEGYKVDNGFTWDYGQSSDSNKNINTSYIDPTCTDYNNGLRQMESNNNQQTNSAVLINKKSIENSTKGSIQIFPNPTSGNFNVILPNNKRSSDITIYNLFSETVWQETNTSELFFTIDISGHPKGLYLVKVVTNGQVSTAKLVLM